ncbi:MAG: SAM-dependent methyltransferase [Pseudohongiellaceae bacterium]|jgi:SAM-dependent methyltransferase
MPSLHASATHPRTGPAAAGLAAAAAATGMQVVLPRFFSVLLWYHLGFLAVSLAMLGFALGGTIVRRRREAGALAGGGLDLGQLGAWASLTLVISLVTVVRLPMETAALSPSPIPGDSYDPTHLAALAAMVVLLSVPFVLLGTLICSALDLGRDRLGKVYGATFLGGALGAGLAVTTLELAGLRATAGVIALLPALINLRRLSPVGLLAFGAAAALLIAPHALLPFTSRKHFPVIQPGQVLLEQDDASSNVVFYTNPEHHGLWGPPAGYGGPMPETIGVAIDAWAITFLTKRSGPDDFPEMIPFHQASLAYHGAEQGSEVLVIGAGGGWDVLSALDAGASHVTAVEINPFIVEAVRGRWAEDTADLYRDPRVTAVVAEGRHFIENDEQLYDRIVLAGVDTFAATQAGSFALAENYLYTLEAMKLWLQHLKPGGVLFLTRWWFHPPRQTLRLALTLQQAMKELGVSDPRRRLYISAAENSLVMAKLHEDFSPGEIGSLHLASQQRGAATVYAWGRPSHPVLSEALDAADPAAWVEAYEYRVDPATDDRPFFFENGRFTRLFSSQGDKFHGRLGGQEILAVTFALLLVLAIPLLGGARNRAAGGLHRLAPFLFLGAGYLLVEVPLLQRLSLLLGHPIYAVAVVLVALLVWSGLGSFLAARLPSRSAPVVLLVTALLISLTLVVGHDWVIAALRGTDLSVRICAVIVWLGPAGLAMGCGFPLALRAIDTELLPSAFLWNGLASVLAGPLAVMIAMAQGFTVTLIVGACCYVAAAAALLIARPAAVAR